MNLGNEFIHNFGTAAQSYFAKVTGDEPATGAPMLKADDLVFLNRDFTGIISLSGEVTGCFYLTASADALEALARIILKREIILKSQLSDIIGEVANNIAGQVQFQSDIDFDISVPLVVMGNLEELQQLKGLKFSVIPVLWGQHKMFLVVGAMLNKN